MEALTGILGLIVIVFSIVLAVLGILLPFFVYRIRNEAIKTNVLLEDIKRLLAK